MKTHIPKIIAALLLLPPMTEAEENYTGFHIAGLPYASYKDGEGFAAGGNLFFFQYGDGNIHPYKWNTTLSAKMSTEGMLSTYLFLDVPQIVGNNSRLNIYLEYKRLLVDDYYGLGNDPDYNPDYLEPDNPQYRDELYYSFKQRWPGVIVSVQLPAFLAPMRHIFSFGHYHRQLEAYRPPNKLTEERPVGYEGGRTSLVQYGLVYDTRDQEAAPQRGTWSDVLVEYAAPSLGSSYEYIRLTLTDRRYYSLHPKIVYAHRLIIEPIFGDAPFYDMAVINGSYERALGLGGAYSLRGIPRLLFVGQHKALANFELRFETWRMTILRQDFTFYIHTFADAGRVWMKDETLNVTDIHLSCGAGLHIRWKKDLVGAIDVARSKYSDMAIYITFRNLF
ncbi:BamA/TamA family outer membrane protein [candidate division KSB1 bacterium]|nr:BamA/TamA family outer membrane protein [candidate division KSB1 bacterium]